MVYVSKTFYIIGAERHIKETLHKYFELDLMIFLSGFGDFLKRRIGIRRKKKDKNGRKRRNRAVKWLMPFARFRNIVFKRKRDEARKYSRRISTIIQALTWSFYRIVFMKWFLKNTF
ncbi:hypothetical protein SDC9_206149 [bioreactor metagenome]|uniref:Uncharacterized protein n=1 Tax=bioreactor metagenome TaxID=1076179 RepID=A0A645JDG3_9ZZZZ